MAMGRLALVDAGPRGAADDGARSRRGALIGVPKNREVLFVTASPNSVISMRSLLANPFDFLGGSVLICSSHFPSGWIVT
jgi:hypothetical protein